MLSEDDGKASNKRVLTCLLFLVFTFSYIHKVIDSAAGAELLDIPEMWALVILGALGVTGGISAWERKNAKP